jgi:hypothetical protein
MGKFITSKSEGFMLLMLGTLAIFLTGYFVFTSSIKTNAKAETVSIIKGILIGDPNHIFPCNQIIKADYVLRDLKVEYQCLPLIADSSQAQSYLGQKVVLKGTFIDSAFHVTEFTSVVR